jgi:hypothetical protein
MIKENDWKERFEQELRQGEIARAGGNEGMARVCARRAAGIAAGEYLMNHRGLRSGPSAYDRLKLLSELPALPEQVRDVARHFLLRITVDHELPVEADLIEEARWLAKELLEAAEEDERGL